MFRMLRVKPPNGWNAVAWELAIVTAGVLIALAAQEWVGERNWRAKVVDTRAGLRSEIADHYSWAVEWRVVEPCILAQIDALAGRVEASGDRLKPAPVYQGANGQHFTLRIPSKEYSTAIWDSAVNEGVANRFNDADQLELNNYYEQLANIKTHVLENSADERSLSIMAHPVRLDPSVRYAILQKLTDLRSRSEFDTLLNGQLIDRVVRLGLVPDAAETRRQVERFGTFQHCRALGLPMRPLTEAMKPVAN